MAQQTSNNSMTAVEWLVEQLKEIGYAGQFTPHLLFEQAKQMEKEQIMNDYKHGQNNGYMYRDSASNIISAEQYYNETYGNNTLNTDK